MKNHPSFRERYAAAREDVLQRRERKALMKTVPSALNVTMKVHGQGELELFLGRNWELLTAVPLGRGAGIVDYIITKPRKQLSDELQDASH